MDVVIARLSFSCVCNDANRLASRDFLLIAEMPEIQTAIAYIMGKIVFASFASIPSSANALRRSTPGAAAGSVDIPSHRMGLQTE
jgi:hypothetical protein